MNEEYYRKKLWNKVSKEFEDFKEEQLGLSKEEIFNNAFRISTLSDFVDMCEPEMGIFSLDEVKVLLKEEYPAHTLYYEYMDSDAGSYSEKYDAVWYKLSALIDKSKEQINKNKVDKER